MLVAGNMIGTGVFLLPVNLASGRRHRDLRLGDRDRRRRARWASSSPSWASSIRRRAGRTPTRATSWARTRASRPTTSTGSATGSATSRSRWRPWATSPELDSAHQRPAVASVIATAARDLAAHRSPTSWARAWSARSRPGPCCSRSSRSSASRCSAGSGSTPRRSSRAGTSAAAPDMHAISRAGLDGAVGLHGHRERGRVGRRDREPEAQHSARHAHRPRRSRRSSTC